MFPRIMKKSPLSWPYGALRGFLLFQLLIDIDLEVAGVPFHPKDLPVVIDPGPYVFKVVIGIRISVPV
jgi:hypothetical protein